LEINPARSAKLEGQPLISASSQAEDSPPHRSPDIRQAGCYLSINQI